MAFNNKDSNEPDKTGDIISWVIIVILMFVLPPAGWILLLIKLGVIGNRKGTPKKKRSKLDKKTGKGMSVFLVLVSIAFLITGITVTTGALTEWANRGLFVNIAELSWGALCLLTAGICFLTRNIVPRRFTRYKNYTAFSEGHGIVPLESLAQNAGVSIKTVKRDIQAMMMAGYIRSDAYIDNERGLLILSPADGKKLRMGEINDIVDASELDNVNEEGQAGIYAANLAELREAKSFIKDETISQKVQKLEDLTEKIFQIAQDNPEKQSQLKRFMSYYLPTTLKLVRSYATLEKQGIKGENITSTKTNICNVLDTLSTGFEQQLDQLFKSDAIDIATDINVLENLMQQDGLASDKSEFQVTASGTF